MEKSLLNKYLRSKYALDGDATRSTLSRKARIRRALKKAGKRSLTKDLNKDSENAW